MNDRNESLFPPNSKPQLMKCPHYKGRLVPRDCVNCTSWNDFNDVCLKDFEVPHDIEDLPH